MRVTLSFDNGPDPEVTPRVLDLLDQHGVRAHFYVLGKNLLEPAGRAIVERALGAGHVVGNHSFSHAVPLGEDARPDAVEREIEATQALLDGIAPGPRRFRPFGGGGILGRHLLSPRAVEHLCAHGYSCVLWSCVPGDWRDPDGWPEVALAALRDEAHGVVVLHDVPRACLDRLDDFLGALRARGGEAVLDVPPACAPIVEGRVVGDLAPLVQGGAS